MLNSFALGAASAAILAGTACASTSPTPAAPDNVEALMEDALATYPSAGMAIVRIQDGEIAWSAHAGEQGPSVPVDEATLFNTASIAKTITAELILQLAAAGHVSLDEPIASEYVHPHLADDPRYGLLTPRLILSHQSGLKNWPHSYDDNRLAFVGEPGTGYSYSGAAYEILAEFAAARMGAPFEDLVQIHVLDPMGVEAWLGAQNAPAERRAVPMGMDAAYGEIREWEFEPSAADNLFVSAPQYARFIIAAMQADETGPMQGSRGTQVVSTDEEAPCALEDPTLCPIANGHTLGWSVSHFEDAHFVFHGGADWGENAIALYDTVGEDGYVVLVNGGNGLGSMLQLIGDLDPGHKLINTIRALPQVQGALSQMRAADE